jgi:hypothetical protein
VQTASKLQVRRPLYRTSVARWKRYEKHLSPLQQALAAESPSPATLSAYFSEPAAVDALDQLFASLELERAAR